MPKEAIVINAFSFVISEELELNFPFCVILKI